jgi:transposase
MLRRLKSDEARSLAVAAKQLNYSLRQCQRWFKSYQTEGLGGLLKASCQGKASGERMTAEAWQALDQALSEGRIRQARDARELVAEYGVVYRSDSSLLKLFARHKIKAKTGRPRHQKADVAAQDAFKKTLLTP